MTWLTTAMGVGIVIGTSVGGKVVDAWGSRASFGATACYAALGIPAALLASRALARREALSLPEVTAAESS